MYPKQITFNQPRYYCTSCKQNCRKKKCSFNAISLDNNDISKLEDPDTIVAPENIIINADYPLKAKFSFEFTNPGGFTRANFAKTFCTLYKNIYMEEAQTIQNYPIIPLEQRQGMINRNETDGKYGIWGHDLGDLIVEAVDHVDTTEDGYYVYELIISS